MQPPLSRRDFVRRASLTLAAAGAARAQTTAPAVDPPPLPMNPLGRTGVKVTRLGMGASFPEYGPRILRFGYQLGVRYFDNAEGYLGGKTETLFGEFVTRLPRREEVFIVSKTHEHKSPEAFYRHALSSREKLGVETIDLYMAHGISNPDLPLDKGGEWKAVKERLVREKVIRFMGFSTHAPMPQRIACLVNAAKGGWVDALMVACDPGLIRSDDAFNRALDTVHKAGIGLVAMKTSRGLGRAAEQPEAARDAFQKLGVGPHVAMQIGLMQDGRFACICSEMVNRKQIEENTQAARNFRPLTPEQQKMLYEGIEGLSRATCPGCTGACQQAAGTQTDFCSITRFLSYFEQDGKRARARELFAQLPPEARDWTGADLTAASRACPAHLDFERLLERAARLLA